MPIGQNSLCKKFEQSCTVDKGSILSPTFVLPFIPDIYFKIFPGLFIPLASIVWKYFAI